MRNTFLEKLGLLVLLVVGLALPSLANTISSQGFSPDRGSRSHHDSSDDIQNSEGPGINTLSGDTHFRPSRYSTFNSTQDDDVVIPPTLNTNGPLADNPLAPDVPADPVPEPSTIMFLAPAAIGLFKKFRH